MVLLGFYVPFCLSQSRLVHNFFRVARKHNSYISLLKIGDHVQHKHDGRIGRVVKVEGSAIEVTWDATGNTERLFEWDVNNVNPGNPGARPPKA